jgi:hypothetical protein
MVQGSQLVAGAVKNVHGDSGITAGKRRPGAADLPILSSPLHKNILIYRTSKSAL